MPDPSRHVPLRDIPWREAVVAEAIDEIVADAHANFDQERFWPAHPADEQSRNGDTSIYWGATGVIWALNHLAAAGATARSIDFRPVLPRLIAASKALFSRYDYAAHGSLLFGDMGTLLLAMRLAPTQSVADEIHARAAGNSTLPVRELMWGLPGSMLASLHMDAMTGEPRWRELFVAQASRLIDDLVEAPGGPLWTQDLYGRHVQYLGAVHGYAGNMIPFINGWRWLDEDQRRRLAAVIPATLIAHAWRSPQGATWHAAAPRGPTPVLCQHCHGAPGMVTCLADAPFSAPELETILAEGGNLTWSAGPLAKGSNLCHGTGGNGYAFLKLFRRTKDLIWLERARAFAMTAIAQCHEARAALGRGRYSLWTGDIGLAVYLRDCVTAAPAFPTTDVF